MGGREEESWERTPGGCAAAIASEALECGTLQSAGSPGACEAIEVHLEPLAAVLSVHLARHYAAAVSEP